jgi:hypothetical protein
MSIKIDVDDAVLAKVEKIARARNTSVAGLVNDFLCGIAPAPDNRQDARRRLLELAEQSKGEVGERTWTRDSLYDR